MYTHKTLAGTIESCGTQLLEPIQADWNSRIKICLLVQVDLAPRRRGRIHACSLTSPRNVLYGGGEYLEIIGWVNETDCLIAGMPA